MNRRDFVRLGAGALAFAGLPAPSVAFDIERDRMAEWRRSRRFAPTAFGSIAYVRSGHGEPALFLHGYPLNSFQWRTAFERLDFLYTCIAPDFLGLGATEVAPGQDLGARNQAAMILALLDTLKLRRVHIVASDSGGAVAQLLAAHHPDRVRSLILTNCDTERQSPPPAMLPVIALAKQGQYAAQWLDPWLADPKRARGRDQFGGMCYADPANPTDAAIEMYFAPLLANAARRHQVEAHAIAQGNNALAGIGPALARSPVPTRILWGTADTIFDSANADFLDRAFGNSHGVRRLAGSKLFWPEERPEIIAEEADRLWRTVRA